MYSIEEYKLGNKNFEEVIDGLKKVLNGMKLKSLDIFMKELNL